VMEGCFQRHYRSKAGGDLELTHPVFSTGFPDEGEAAGCREFPISIKMAGRTYARHEGEEVHYSRAIYATGPLMVIAGHTTDLGAGWKAQGYSEELLPPVLGAAGICWASTSSCLRDHYHDDTGRHGRRTWH